MGAEVDESAERTDQGPVPLVQVTRFISPSLLSIITLLSRLFGRVVLQSRFTQKDQFRFPSPQKTKTFYTGHTDMQKSVAHPTNLNPTTVFDRRTKGLGENSYPDIARLLLGEAVSIETRPETPGR